MFFAAALLNVQLHLQPDEANAVLNILDKRAAHEGVVDADWQRVFASEGYVRLQQRELSMKRKFENDDFKTFANSDELLAQRAELHRVLDDWRRADLDGAAKRALAYLPPGAKIAATVYPVIKPQHNNFVFEGNAIFMTVEDQPRERFEAIIAHELHHIGFDSACGGHPDTPLINWITAFGEGFATLAAGGDRDPERMMKPDVEAAFKEGLRDYNKHFREVEKFFLDIVDGRLTGDAIRDRGFQFFGLVGPWYTVGWKMAVTIEQKRGRRALIDAMCDPRTLFATYNKAAGPDLPKWDERLIKAVMKPSS
ncbi:MAG TPA: DUF5700 domain-containing putative Zn-dependent protease [Thermoanaerobaculia bacterium]|nr:DUF5700 domain-containing putative Zn-dependent protease [Thermoanaerobaculia bacterium]